MSKMTTLIYQILILSPIRLPRREILPTAQQSPFAKPECKSWQANYWMQLVITMKPKGSCWSIKTSCWSHWKIWKLCWYVDQDTIVSLWMGSCLTNLRFNLNRNQIQSTHRKCRAKKDTERTDLQWRNAWKQVRTLRFVQSWNPWETLSWVAKKGKAPANREIWKDGLESRAVEIHHGFSVWWAQTGMKNRSN